MTHSVHAHMLLVACMTVFVCQFMRVAYAPVSCWWTEEASKAGLSAAQLAAKITVFNGFTVGEVWARRRAPSC